jgi:hypothetical protein
MTDKKISVEPNSATAPAGTDAFVTVESMGSVPVTKRKTFSTILAALKTYLLPLEGGGPLSGEVVLGNYNLSDVTNQSLDDDHAVSFTPSRAGGILMVMDTPSADGTNGGIFMYRAAATVFLTTFIAGTNTEATTGALTGTTGSDGKFTVSVHTDGKIYLENRRGIPFITLRWIVF